ncbi:MAG: HAD hydrolase family protein, partial [Pseudomonadota bacterium]
MTELAPMPLIVSTDLDGTLLDHHTYEWRAAIPALAACAAHSIPVIFNTSKNFAEVRSIQEDLASQVSASPLAIVENGSALYFADINKEPKLFGCSRAEIDDFIDIARRQHEFQFECFADWSVEELMINTNL